MSQHSEKFPPHFLYSPDGLPESGPLGPERDPLEPKDIITLLQSVPIFVGTPTEALADMVELLEEVEYKAGNAIVTEGELGTSMYIIYKGRVRVHKGGRTLTESKAGAIFGEMAALNPEPRSASVTAVEDTHLFRLDREPLFRLCERSPAVTHGIIENLCKNLRDSTHNMAEDYQYIQQVNDVSAVAANAELGIYEPDALDGIAERTDELGQLARIFQKMIQEVQLREERLQQKVEHLSIEIDRVKHEKQVDEITNTDFFQDLKEKARKLRRGQNE